MAMKIMPKCLTGYLHNSNKGACDWGWQGFVAFGCQNCVVIVDPITVQIIQVLDTRCGYIVQVKWARENYYHNLASPYTLRLASADFNGKIYVWDAVTGKLGAECYDNTKPVANMEWVALQDISHDLLLALHPPYVILWNTENGSKLWKKTNTDMFISFSFDPYETTRLAFLGQDFIVFYEDFSFSKPLSGGGKKFYISSPSKPISSSLSLDKISMEKRFSKSTIRRVGGILVGESSKKFPGADEETSTLGSSIGNTLESCIQLLFHKACRHHLILLYTREILILDLDINQTVSVISAERTSSPFQQIISTSQRDAIFCLHENGSVSMRVRRWHCNTSTSNSDDHSISPGSSQSYELFYDNHCQSDTLRVAKHNKVFAIAVCPVSEKKIVLVLSTGKFLVWELQSCLQESLENFKYTNSPESINSLAPKISLKSLLNFSSNHSYFASEKLNSNLKFILIGLVNGLPPAPVVIRMCPPLTTKNYKIYQPFLAAGSSNGQIQIYNLSAGQIYKEFAVHSAIVRGIEWIGLRMFLSFAYHNPINGVNLVRNELLLTEIDTGKSTSLRNSTEEEHPIEMIKVSYLKQYFIVVFRERPFEIWDINTCSMLRQMPRNLSSITALEWSPSHTVKSFRKKSLHPPHSGDTSYSIVNEGSMGNSFDNLSYKSSSQASTPNTENVTSEEQLLTSLKEHFVFTDVTGSLFHYIVEGNMIKEGSKIPPDATMSIITGIAWKSETMVLSDIEGSMNFWDLKGKVSKTFQTSRGPIRKIKFAPGRGNMKFLLLFNDGIEIWDAKDMEKYALIKCPKDMAIITDIEWAASDRPVFACSDGIIRIMNINCTVGCSSMEDNQVSDPVFCPHYLQPKFGFILKTLLHNQLWKSNYSLNFTDKLELDDFSNSILEQINLIEFDLKTYMTYCPFGTAQRCLLTAHLFGDESELIFWTIALHYFKYWKKNNTINSDKILIDNTFELSLLNNHSLETCFDILCDNQSFRAYELKRISLHDSKRATNEHTRKCAENLILLGQTDRAVQLLLETESDSVNYYTDSLRACLVASIRSSGASQSTIKLVATNLIANGQISEGVQLLCLIDKGLDACRYLQTYNKWHKAAWLAKISLESTESNEVMKRWADHLSSAQVDQKDRAILVMLSLCQFDRVLELLFVQRHFDRAALFIESCREFGYELKLLGSDFSNLTKSTFLEYARFLLNLGLFKAAKYYFNQAGELGQEMIIELKSIFN